MPDYPIEGFVSIPASGSGGRGMDAVKDLGLDPTGSKDCTPALQEYLNSGAGTRMDLYFTPGEYYFMSTVETNAKNVSLLGDGIVSNMGDGSVVFFTDQPLDAILWWNGSSGSKSNLCGPRIAGIQFQDRGGSLGCCVRLTAMANSELQIGFQHLVPMRYTEGVISVTEGIQEIAGFGTSWNSDMLPGWIVIGGYPYEVLSIDAFDTLTLAIPFQGGTDNGASYALNTGGIGVWLEPGTDFTQYGKAWSLNGRCGCALFASAGVAGGGVFTGTSRIKVLSGYLNGEGIPDSIAAYLGPYSDTFRWDIAMNSYAFGVVVANGHQHDLQHGDYENAGGPPPVTGLPLDYDSCCGILVMSSNGSDCWGNRVGGYFRQVGTAIELYGLDGNAPKQTVICPSTFRSNKMNFVNGNAEDTYNPYGF